MTTKVSFSDEKMAMLREICNMVMNNELSDEEFVAQSLALLPKRQSKSNKVVVKKTKVRRGVGSY